MNLWVTFIKNLIKSSLDQYVLPGTLTGTQILLLYMIQWRRHMADVTAESLLTFFSRLDIPTMAGPKSERPDDQIEN